MVEWHGKSLRKTSGGLRRSINARDHKLYERGGDVANTRLLETNQEAKRQTVKTLGGNQKTKALRLNTANITNPKTKKTRTMEVISVKQNEANKLFVRRNIMTQNAIIEVKDGNQHVLARVTSRPGQTGAVSGVLLDENESKAFEESQAKKTSAKAARTEKAAGKKTGKTAKAPEAETKTATE